METLGRLTRRQVDVLRVIGPRETRGARGFAQVHRRLPESAPAFRARARDPPREARPGRAVSWEIPLDTTWAGYSHRV